MFHTLVSGKALRTRLASDTTGFEAAPGAVRIDDLRCVLFRVKYCKLSSVRNVPVTFDEQIVVAIVQGHFYILW